MKSILLICTTIILVTAALLVEGRHYHRQYQATHSAGVPVVVLQPAVLDATNQQYVAALDVARVFGRAPGCAEADAALIGKVATEALRTGIDPRILAATVAVESSCDSMAVSRRGAVGLTQIMPRIWKGSFDFERAINLFNPTDNLHAGATILSGLIKQYGLSDGIHRYNGTGTDCADCDSNYVPKILVLAGRRQ